MNEPVLIAPEGRLHEESVLIGKRMRAPALPSAEPTVREGVLDIPGELALHHGGRLTGVRLGWRLVGPANAPVSARWAASPRTAACSHVRVSREHSGWWSELAGPGAAARYSPLAHSQLRLPGRQRGVHRARGPAAVVPQPFQL